MSDTPAGTHASRPMSQTHAIPGDTMLSVRLSAAHWQVVMQALGHAGPYYVVAPLVADLGGQLDAQAAAFTAPPAPTFQEPAP